MGDGEGFLVGEGVGEAVGEKVGDSVGNNDNCVGKDVGITVG